jgi:hypothetical protein
MDAAMIPLTCERKKEDKAMKAFRTKWAGLAAGLLAAAWEPVATVSAETSVDTRTCGLGVPEEAGALDSRGFTVDWSDDILLNTKRIIGTMMLLK